MAHTPKIQTLPEVLKRLDRRVSTLERGSRISGVSSTRIEELEAEVRELTIEVARLRAEEGS